MLYTIQVFFSNKRQIFTRRILSICLLQLIQIHMNKSKHSSTSLKNLTTGLKKSMEFDNRKYVKQLPTSRSTLNLRTKSTMEVPTVGSKDISTYDIPTELSKPAEIKEDHDCLQKVLSAERKRQKLCEEIQKLENQVHGCHKEKLVIRKYDDYLNTYDALNKQVSQNLMKLKEQERKVRELEETQMMMDQDRYSHQFNLEQTLAEREHYEEIIHSYQQEYEAESMLLFSVLKGEQSQKELYHELKRISQDVENKQSEVVHWKEQVQYELNKKKINSKIAKIRMQMMIVEEKVDKALQEEGFMKIRELLCLFFGEWIKKSQIIVSQEELEDGMEIFLCNQNSLSLYRNFVHNYQQNRSNFPENDVNEYFKLLQQIDCTLKKSRISQDKQIWDQYRKQIQTLRLQEMNIEQKIENLNKNISEAKEKLQLNFANQSIVIIQHMREKEGRYDIKEIKKTLKQIKQQHKDRIQQIKNIFWVLQEKNRKNHIFDEVKYLNQKQQLNEFVEKQKVELKDLKMNQRTLEKDKQQIECHLTLAVSKWSDKTSKKEKLKNLYKDLSHTNKQLKQLKLNRFEERTIQRKKDPLKLTKKLMTQFTTSSKQNKQSALLLNSALRQTTNSKVITRKPSLSSFNKLQTAKSNFQPNSQRASLTAMLISKLTKY